DQSWRYMLQRQDVVGTMQRCATNLYDVDIFALVWPYVVQACTTLFASAERDRIQERAVHGYVLCCSVAAQFNFTSVFDAVFPALYEFSGVYNLPVQPQAAAVLFGINRRGNMATRALFQLARLHTNKLRILAWKTL